LRNDAGFAMRCIDSSGISQLRDEGKLTEKQEQLLEKLEKRLTKINNLKEEIRRIKAKQEAGAGGKEKEQKMREMEDMIGMKDDPGGGILTAGQLRAIEKNEAQIKKHEADMLPQEEALAELLRTM
jgi:transposase